MNNCPSIVTQNKNDHDNKDFELSHIIGLNTNIRNPVQIHPLINESIVYCVGGIIITEDLVDKNKQVFFRHCNYQISCYRVSNSGRFLSVGFTSRDLEKSLPVSVILWDYDNKEIIYELAGLTKSVTIIEFSQDDKFIAACGSDNYLYIWEVETGYKCLSRVYDLPTTFIYWTTIYYTHGFNNHSQPNYTITVGNINGLIYLDLFFELKSMQYNISTKKFTLPSTGFIRNFVCGVYDSSINGLYLGTTGGELVLFAIENLIYKMSMNITNNGVTALILIPEDSINKLPILIVGGGDGRVRKLIRERGTVNNTKHQLISEIQLDSKVTSLALLSDGREIICSTFLGNIFRILVDDFTFTLHSKAHTASVNDLYFISNNLCLIADDNSNVFMWDLNEFSIVSSLSENSPAKSLVIGDDQALYIGFGNGFVKNYLLHMNDHSYIKQWEIVAHRGAVNCLYVDGNYILTGGEDGIVRVWARTTHELIIQLSAHHKDVYNVFPDVNKPNLVYSCGADRSLNTFDLKLQKRVNLHNLKNGVIRGITQRIDGENEIISCGYNCKLNIWDFYQSEPVGEINLNENFYCIKISNNGRYFAMGSDLGELWVFKLPDYQFIGKSTGHSQKINSLKWSPDDKQIMSVSSDSSICVWNFYRIFN